jgi:hypothetical protein
MRALKMLGSDDCVRTALACLLDCPDPSHVPHFFQDTTIAEVGYARMREYLAASWKMGIVVYGVPGTMDAEELNEAFGTTNPDLYYIMIGVNGRGVHHAVVCRGSQQIHDPAWNGLGIRGPGLLPDGSPIYSIIVLVPLSQVS